MSDPSAAAEALRARFEAPSLATVGLEEELMLLDPDTLDLSPVSAQVLEQVDGDERFKPELPASQLEIVTSPAPRVRDVASQLATARRELARAGDGLVRLAAAGTHPFAAAEGPLSAGERYAALEAEFGTLARRQLVCALQIHVAIRGAERALAVHNALRCHLPEIAALAANAPFHEGRDTGLASVRPLIAQTLPRQGIPPALSSWEAFAEALRSGGAGGGTELHRWWWELRLNPAWGTLEVRVPDAQTTVREAAAVAAVVHCLAVWLAERHAAGEPLESADTWRIADNRSAALRSGVDAHLVDLASGRRRAARERLDEFLTVLGPTARGLDCERELEDARAALDRPPHARQRKVAAGGGTRALASWLCERFLE